MVLADVVTGRSAWLVPLLLSASLSTALVGCSEVSVALGGLPCDSDDQCLPGYACQSDSRRCMSDLSLGCHADALETCDGRDNDCNDTIDEGFDVGAVCGIGACAGGVRECLPDGSGARCSTMPGGTADRSTPETCDDVDRDCDGSTTNGFDVGTPCGLGACAGGLVECAPDGLASHCSSMPGGSASRSETETCNNLDDDCDGTVDNGLGLACRCTDGDAEPLARELCGEVGLGDAIDDNCNGAVDEGCGIIVPTNLGPVDLCAGTRALRVRGSGVVIDTTLGTIDGAQAPAKRLIVQPDGAPVITVLFFHSIEVSSNAVLRVEGVPALALVACEDITVAGRIDLCASGRAAGPGGWAGGNAGNAQSAGSGPGGGSAGKDATRWPWLTSGGGGGAFGHLGGQGGPAEDDDSRLHGGAAGTLNGSQPLHPLMGGSGGGAGGRWADDGAQHGGGGGGVLQLVAARNLVVTATGAVTACGAGGGVNGRGWGAGGGGGSGGGILLEALTITIEGTLAANGGGGGGGDVTSDEGNDEGEDDATPGEDGRLDAQRASGGEGADGKKKKGGDGGTGGAGQEPAGATGQTAHCAGGGGGGAGRIRINVPQPSAHTLDADAVISPPHTLGVVTFQHQQ